MADKKFLEREQLTDEELDRVAGGTGGCGTPAPDDIHEEIPPWCEPPAPDEIHPEQEPVLNPVTPPVIPPINPAGEVDIVEPPFPYK